MSNTMNQSLLNREIEFASVPESINLVESMVEELKSEMGMNEVMEANVLVTLSEAVNNAISHGNKNDSKKKVKVFISKDGNNLSLSVKDEGSGFDTEHIQDPTAVENLDKPTGRGVFLMRSLADKVEFAENGSKVMITFLLN